MDPQAQINLAVSLENAAGSGIHVVGTELFIGGGNSTNDQVKVTPIGASGTGSTGIHVNATLDGTHFSETFQQSFTAIQILGYDGNENIQLADSLTITTYVNAGNGNDKIEAGDGNNIITVGNGNDHVQAGDGNNTITVGNGNDHVQAGNGNNVVVAGNGNDKIEAGNGDNLIAAGLGQHDVQVGDGSNILIDGAVTLTQSGDSLQQVLDDWRADGLAAVSSIRARLHVTYNNSHANKLFAGKGLDWFWETYAGDKTNEKLTDLLN